MKGSFVVYGLTVFEDDFITNGLFQFKYNVLIEISDSSFQLIIRDCFNSNMYNVLMERAR